MPEAGLFRRAGLTACSSLLACGRQQSSGGPSALHSFCQTSLICPNHPTPPSLTQASMWEPVSLDKCLSWNGVRCLCCLAPHGLPWAVQSQRQRRERNLGPGCCRSCPWPSRVLIIQGTKLKPPPATSRWILEPLAGSWSRKAMYRPREDCPLFAHSCSFGLEV